MSEVPRVRRWLYRGTSLIVATALSLGIAEGLARRASPSPPEVPGRDIPRGLLADCVVTDASRGWAFRPGACGRDADGLLRLASRGADDSAWTLLLEGDSVGENAWTHPLPDALAAELGRPVVVLNGAVSGYNTCQEAGALRAHLGAVRVDAVVVQTCVNDLGGSVTLLPSSPGWSKVFAAGRWRSIPTPLLDLRLGQLALATVLASPRTPTSTANVAVPSAFLTPAMATRCAQDIQAQADAAGVPLAVLHFPALVDVTEDTPPLEHLRRQEADVQRAWAGVTARQLQGRSVLEPLGALAERATSDEDRLHPSPRAAQAIADAVAPALANALTPR